MKFNIILTLLVTSFTLAMTWPLMIKKIMTEEGFELKKLLKKEYTIEKPLKKSNLTHSVVKRIASGVKVKEVKNGFSAIIQTKNGEPPIKRNRKCLEWFKIELINRWKCITVQFSSGKIIKIY